MRSICLRCNGRAMLLMQLLTVALWSARLVACQSSAANRLPTDVTPGLYDLNITTNLDNFTFFGQEHIQLNCHKETSQIKLHAKQLLVNSVTLKDSSNTDVKVTSTSAGDFDILTIKLASTLEAGKVYHLHVEFEANLTTGLQGYYRSSYIDRDGQSKWLSVTQLSFDNARMVFPCWDEPLFRANFSIFLAHRSNLQAISNMPLLTQTTHESLEGFVWSQFQQTPPIAVQVIAFLIGEFESVTVDSGNTPITIHTTPGKVNQAQLALSIVPDLLSYYEHYFNRVFPLPKLDYVTVPDFFYDGMENWGCITCSVVELLYNSSMSTAQKYDLCLTVTHEMMHQWIGDLVELDWWDGMWLKEGFAYHFEGFALNQVFPDWNAGVREVISYTLESFPNDASSSAALAIQNQIDDPNGYPGTYNYAATYKATLIVYMIRSFLGDEIFQLGLQIYIERFEYQSVNKSALYSSFDEASRGKDLLPEGLSIANILESWVLQPGLPLLTCARQGSTITVVQQRFYDLELNRTSEGSERWWIPVTVSTASNVNFDTTTTVWMNPTQTELTVETKAKEEDWIIVNIKSAVYCVVNYDTHSWSLIINHLHTGELSLIDEFNRYSLISDIFHLARVGYVQYSLAFQLIRYSVRERSYVAWLGPNVVFADLEPLLKRTEVFPQFKALVQDLLRDTYDSLGFITEEPDQFQNLRLKILVISWAVEYDLENCVNEALQVFRQWKTGEIDSSQVSVDFLWYVALVGVKNGGQDEWEFVYKHVNQTTTSKQFSNFLYALAWSQHKDILERYLSLTLDTTSNIPLSSAYEVFEDVTGTTKLGFDTAFTFLENNAEKIDKYTGNLGAYISAIYSRCVFEEDIKKMKSFLTSHTQLVSSYQSDIDSGLKNAQLNLLWSSKYYKEVSATLSA